MKVWPGKPFPLGATWDGEGTNFSLFSEHAERVELCLFDPKGRREIERVTGRDLAIGAVYATLDRLEAKKLLRSSRRGADGPSRRVFELTREGARQLVETHALREQLWAGVDLRKLRLRAT